MAVHSVCSRRSLWLAFCLLAALTGTAAAHEEAASTDPLGDADRAALTPISTTRITIAAEPDYPPYSFIDEAGRPTGFSVELFEAAARAMDIELEIRSDLWVTIRDDLAEGRIDALPLVGRTPEREELFDFTVPYLSLYGGIVVHADTTDIHNLEDLRGRRIAVMSGDNAEEFLRRNGFLPDLTIVPSFVDALHLVEGGAADAVLMQRVVALRLLEGGDFSDLRVLDDRVREFRQDFSFAVREGDRELLSLLNEGLAIVIANGTLRRLQTRWFAGPELPSRTIVVGGSANYPPFEYLDEHGVPAGYNVDLTRAIARELGFDVTIRLGSPGGMTEMLSSGRIDALQGLVYSPARDEEFDFSPAHTSHQYVAIALGQTAREIPNTWAELRGSRVAVAAGDAIEEFALAGRLSAELTPVSSLEEALARVARGEVDYALGNRTTALHLIRENGWEDLAIGRHGLLTEQSGYAVRDGDAALLALFTDGLAILEESGEYRRIYEEWLGVHEQPAGQPWLVVRTVLLIVSPLLILLLGTMLWNRALRRQVMLRTDELRTSERRHRLLAENSIDAIWLLSDRLRVRYVNPSIQFLTGHTVEEVVGTPVRDYVTSESFRALAGAIRATIAPDRSAVRGFSAETDLVRVDGTTIHVEITGTILRGGDGAIEGYQGVVRDLTERVRYQRALEESNRSLAVSLTEKETLLKEVHHRVKNNLNVIISLLRLQEDRIESVADAKDAFEQSRNRIYSMALVHRSLYQSGNLAEVDLGRYIAELVEQLTDSLDRGRCIQVTSQLDHVPISIDYAVPFGIIMNELVTNAYKHAFADGSTGTLAISLRDDGTEMCLTVRDDGVGIPNERLEGAPESLGLHLIRALADQISAQLDFTAGPGTTVHVRIPSSAIRQPEPSAVG